MKLDKSDKKHITERLINGATSGFDTSLEYLLDEYNEVLGDEIINFSSKLEYKNINKELSSLYEVFIQVIESKSGYKMSKNEVTDLINKYEKGCFLLSNKKG